MGWPRGAKAAGRRRARLEKATVCMHAPKAPSADAFRSPRLEVGRRDILLVARVRCTGWVPFTCSHSGKPLGRILVGHLAAHPRPDPLRIRKSQSRPTIMHRANCALGNMRTRGEFKKRQSGQANYLFHSPSYFGSLLICKPLDPLAQRGD